MAIIGTPYILNAGRIQRESGNSKSRTERWRVMTQPGVGDEMDIALSHTLFRIGRPHPKVRGLTLNDRSAELVNDQNTSEWVVTLEWVTTSSGTGTGTDEEDPLNMQPLFNWSSWSEKDSVVEDKATGNPIMNAAGDLIINPPLFEERSWPQVTITVNETDFFEERLIFGVGRMNSAPFRIQDITVPKFCAKLIAYTGAETQLPNGNGFYFRSTYVFKLNFSLVGPRTHILFDISPGNGAGTEIVPENEIKGFRRKVLNAGTRQLGIDGPIPIKDGKNGIINEPRALLLAGTPIKGVAFGKETYFLHETLEKTDFSSYPTVREAL